ncbi:MAG: signal peptide peptidase SppA [Actinomycetota bacterium]
METSVARPRRNRGMVLLVVGLVLWVATLMAGVAILGISSVGPAYIESSWDEAHVSGRGEKIAMIDMTGEIVSGSGAFFAPSGGPEFGSDDYVGQLRQAAEDESVRAVIIRMDTPGGSVVASEEIHTAVREVAKDMPVIVLMDGVAASGGYYIATAATKIVAHADTITGSIGVIAEFPNVSGTAEKLGARMVVIKSGEFKDIGSPFRDMTTAEQRLLQGMVDEAYGHFVGVVSDGRGISPEKVRAFADGRVFSGSEAKRLGLVDEVGGYDDAVARAKALADVPEDADVEVVRYTWPPFGLGYMLGAKLSGLGRGSMLEQVRREFGMPARAGLGYLWLG